MAERFELYFKGVELANGFGELGDASEQRRRFESEIAARQKLGRPFGPLDESLIAALDAGLPPCAGVAVGVERLHMALAKTNNIADVVTFVSGNADD